MQAGFEQALSQLAARLRGKVLTSEGARAAHAHDESRHEAVLPEAVCFPLDTADVSVLLEISSKHGIPLTAFGAGTGLEGGCIPVRGGLSVDFSTMNRVLALHTEDLDVVVQPGLTHRSLNQAIRTSGLFFPVDPGADASLGGMAATRASGTNAVRYGTMRENVLALEVVLADGRVIRTGRRTKKSAAGYDLTRLFVGSEGTLGVITELTLKLQGIPEQIAAAVCPFETLAGAVDTVIQTIQSGIPVARIELLDDVQVDAVNRYAKLALPILNTLFIEFHGTPGGVAEQAAAVQALAKENGGGVFAWKTIPEQRSQLWKARHDVAWACKALRTGAVFFSTDVCVPISRLTECILETKRDLERTDLLAPLVGHVGDGNFHLTILVTPGNERELAEAHAINAALIERALAMDGTCTGEHGVGIGKRSYLAAEHGEGLDVMRLLKHTLDPLGVLNPGKIFL